MQPYKEYFIEGKAVPVHPFNPDWYVAGAVLVARRSTLIVEIMRFQLYQFTVTMKELAEWFGLELSRIIVDELLSADRWKRVHGSSESIFRRNQSNPTPHFTH